LKRDGYRVEKIVFQTRPGVQMTANAYVPDGDGKRPAVLVVHGHWRGAKQDPVVQARCIGLAKLGFFVLAVDAFGAGERGLGKNLGEYHGAMTGATLWPIGLPLSGLQVYENMRAVDYLQSRPEVDPAKLGITGASGGGNQTMYAGAFDERFGCVVPVCSVGTYQSYLGAACCLCEVVPNAITYTEESGLLAMVAPRGLMVVSATKDSYQFSVGEAAKSVADAKLVFRLFDKESSIRHSIFESPHDYNRDMRAAMYGWMTLHLKGQGTGEPIPEPAHKIEDPEELRCFPGQSRPDDWVTIPQFAAAEGRRLVTALNEDRPSHVEEWQADSETLRRRLVDVVIREAPSRSPIDAIVEPVKGNDKQQTWTVETEPGITITATHHLGSRKPSRLAVVLDLDGTEAAAKRPLVAELRKANWDVMLVDLRGTGQYAVAGDTIGATPDHNSAEWATWTGRPLLGQWAWDVQRLLDAVTVLSPDLAKDVTLFGFGSAGVVAMVTAIFDDTVDRVVTVGSLATYVTDAPYAGQRLGIMAPGILRHVGDIPHLAALVAPRRFVIANPVAGDGKELEDDAVLPAYQFTRQIYAMHKAERQLHVLATDDAGAILRAVP
jgi:dienelactone hydrolase